MKTKIPIHSNELSAAGIELLPFIDVCRGPNTPHRDDHYMFILQQKGKSVWTIDFREWKLDQISLGFVAPGQVHQNLKTKNTEGWLIFVEPNLIPGEYRMMLDTFMHHYQIIRVGKDHPVFALTEILHRLITEKKKVFYQSVLHSFVNAFTGLLTTAFIPEDRVNAEAGSHKYQLVIAFKNLIKKQFREVKQVKDYAVLLNITPLYLNEVTKAVTGFIASYWIQKEILLEAQRLLSYTDMDIKEIAFSLGYEDHTYFSRFFRKNIGTTATTFREKNHYLSNHHHE